MTAGVACADELPQSARTRLAQPTASQNLILLAAAQPPGFYADGFNRPLSSRDLNQLQQSPNVRQPNLSGVPMGGPLVVPDQIYGFGPLYGAGAVYAPNWPNSGLVRRGVPAPGDRTFLQHPGYPFYRGVWPGMFWYPVMSSSTLPIAPPVSSLAEQSLSAQPGAYSPVPAGIPWVYGAEELPGRVPRLPFGMATSRPGTLAAAYQIGEIVDADVELETRVHVQHPEHAAGDSVERVIAVRSPELPAATDAAADAVAGEGADGARQTARSASIVFVAVRVPPQPIRKLWISPDGADVRLQWTAHQVLIHSGEDAVTVTYSR